MQAAKQAAPEQSDEADEETFCGVCEQLYAELTEENENWIRDICPTWYHFECVGIHMGEESTIGNLINNLAPMQGN